MMAARKTKIKNIVKNCRTDKARKAASGNFPGGHKRRRWDDFSLFFTDSLASVKKNEYNKVK